TGPALTIIFVRVARPMEFRISSMIIWVQRQASRMRAEAWLRRLPTILLETAPEVPARGMATPVVSAIPMQESFTTVRGSMIRRLVGSSLKILVGFGAE